MLWLGLTLSLAGSGLNVDPTATIAVPQALEVVQVAAGTVGIPPRRVEVAAGTVGIPPRRVEVAAGTVGIPPKRVAA